MSEGMIQLIPDNLIIDAHNTAVRYLEHIQKQRREPEIYKKTISDIVSLYLAYDALCCCLVSDGNPDTWDQISRYLKKDAGFIAEKLTRFEHSFCNAETIEVIE